MLIEGELGLSTKFYTGWTQWAIQHLPSKSKTPSVEWALPQQVYVAFWFLWGSSVVSSSSYIQSWSFLSPVSDRFVTGVDGFLKVWAGLYLLFFPSIHSVKRSFDKSFSFHRIIIFILPPCGSNRPGSLTCFSLQLDPFLYQAGKIY